MSDTERFRDPQIKKPCDPELQQHGGASMTPTRSKHLDDRLEFLQSRVNAHSDPYVQKLIAETEADCRQNETRQTAAREKAKMTRRFSRRTPVGPVGHQHSRFPASLRAIYPMHEDLHDK
jgi:hypothetical protein